MQNNRETGPPKMSENRDSFEFSVGMSGFSLKAQGKVTALLSAMMSIGALTVAAYFAQEAFIPIMKKRMRLEGGEDETQSRSIKFHSDEEDEEDKPTRTLRTRARRSAPVLDELAEADRVEVRSQNETREEMQVVERKRPVYVAAGISLVAVATSIYFGRKAWLNLAGRVSRLPRSE
ncbi:uncharacterized protein [Anabrus simplex]|uniref:uncharacterized protein n=1 Tax=Anabrus simplex TaxID=316456 RepID=UPI0034DD3481